MDSQYLLATTRPSISRLSPFTFHPLLWLAVLVTFHRPAQLGLCSRFQDHIERRFCRAANLRKSSLRENVSQASLAGLRSQGKTDVLAERTGSAYHRREPVIQSADRIKIFSQRISGQGLHNHKCALGLQGSFDVRRGANGITHVMESIEHGDKSIVITWEIFRRRNTEIDVRNLLLLSVAIRCVDRSRMQIKSIELGVRKRLRHDQGGDAMTAANVCYPNSGVQLSFDPVQCGYPILIDIGLITGAKESLDPAKKAVVMPSPR